MRNELCANVTNGVTCGHPRHEHFDNVGNDTRCIHHMNEESVLPPSDDTVFCPCPAFVPSGVSE